MSDTKPKLVNLETKTAAEPEKLAITKPGAFNLDKFKSQQSATIANVETKLTALPHHPLKDAGDYCRLHWDEERYWSPEYCFVPVPIKGQSRDTLHLIAEELAMRYLSSGKIKRFRLALATKPYDRLFLCHVPSQNLDNSFNQSNLLGCEKAKELWTELTNRRNEGVDAYKIDAAIHSDAFPEPTWPAQSLDDLIMVTFTGRMIGKADHPGLLRLIGARQSAS